MSDQTNEQGQEQLYSSEDHIQIDDDVFTEALQAMDSAGSKDDPLADAQAADAQNQDTEDKSSPALNPETADAQPANDQSTDAQQSQQQQEPEPTPEPEKAPKEEPNPKMEQMVEKILFLDSEVRKLREQNKSLQESNPDDLKQMFMEDPVAAAKHVGLDHWKVLDLWEKLGGPGKSTSEEAPSGDSQEVAALKKQIEELKQLVTTNTERTTKDMDVVYLQQTLNQMPDLYYVRKYPGTLSLTLRMIENYRKDPASKNVPVPYDRILSAAEEYLATKRKEWISLGDPNETQQADPPEQEQQVQQSFQEQKPESNQQQQQVIEPDDPIKDEKELDDEERFRLAELAMAQVRAKRGQ